MPNPLPPGPELDRLIAEKVMGWKQGGAFGIAYWLDHENQCAHDRGWSPSTSIADAWEVVERVKSMTGNLLRLHDEHDCWQVWFTETHGPSSQASTAPHAICLAALSAQEKGVAQ